MRRRRSTAADRGALELMKFRIAGRERLLHAKALSAYLSSANFGFTSVRDEHAMLRANLVHIGRYTFAHVQLPPATLEWPRDELSRSRVVVIVAEAPGFTVASEGPVIVREPSWFVIPPGGATVTFEATMPTELVFISLDEDALSGGRQVDFDRVGEQPPSEETLRPLTSFVKSFCAIEADEPDGVVSPLEDAACEVARTLVATVVGEPVTRPQLFDSVMRFILRDYSSPRLSVAGVAEALGVSVRTVQSALSEHGTTFSRELRAIRLKAAADLKNRNPGLPLATVAQLTGFGTRQSLHRAQRDALSR
ncbi:helix-turn-helix domain-containing protein [Microbacterium sp. SSW1-49]|uniref:Helix-turn-helix domain-containing protein n=1 Tax=Microbacterium croceum TaxID=2851645 RepID=A0ABT0FIK4_9MICO|nr:helix-turn-helix domain-containing protein [Microbacterium croceum]MCK2037888.1 helix-turn-helix domain-containing protein [Microbacterium croceum]